MIGAAVNFLLFIVGLFFKKPPVFDEGKQAGATEVQKDEVQRTLKKVVQADAVRDAVARVPDGRLRDDAGNLYRD